MLCKNKQTTTKPQNWQPYQERIAGLVSLIYTGGNLGLEQLRSLLQLKTDRKPTCAGDNLCPVHCAISSDSWYSRSSTKGRRGGRRADGNEVPLAQEVLGSHFKWLRCDTLCLSLVQGPVIPRGSGQRELTCCCPAKMSCCILFLSITHQSVSHC